MSSCSPNGHTDRHTDSMKTLPSRIRGGGGGGGNNKNHSEHRPITVEAVISTVTYDHKLIYQNNLLHLKQTHDRFHCTMYVVNLYRCIVL